MKIVSNEVIAQSLCTCGIKFRHVLSRLSLAIERMEVVRHDGEYAYNHNRPPAYESQ